MKIIVNNFLILVLSIFFTSQVLFAENEQKPKVRKNFYKEKIAALRVVAKFSEKEGNEEKIKANYEMLAKTCEDAINDPNISERFKTKAKKYLAEAKFKLGYKDEALQDCEDIAYSKNQSDRSALNLKATFYKKMGDDLVKEKNYEEGISKYKDAIDLDISSQKKAFFKGVIATTYLQMNDYDKVIEWDQKILDEHPDEINSCACALIIMATAYECKNDIDKAKETYLRVIEEYSSSSWVDCAKENLKLLQDVAGEKNVE